MPQIGRKGGQEVSYSPDQHLWGATDVATVLTQALVEPPLLVVLTPSNSGIAASARNHTQLHRVFVGPLAPIGSRVCGH